MTQIRLLILPDQPDRPLTLLEADGLGSSRREVAADERLDGPFVLVAPGEAVVCRWMELPVGSPAQARSAAAFRLEDEVALGVEELHIAVGERDAAGRTLVAWTAREILRAWLDRALAHGVAPQAVTPDYLLLPADETGQVVIAPFGERLAFRGPGLAFTGEPDLGARIAGEQEHRYIPADALDPWLAAGARAPAVNLLQGQFAVGQETAGPGLKRLVWLAAAVILSPLVLLGARMAHDGLLARSLERQAATLAVSRFPQAARYEDAAAYALSRLNQRRASFGQLAAGYLTVVRGQSGVTLDTLVYGRDGALRSTVAYANYSDMDQLRAAARKAGLELVEQSTVTEGARITSDLVVRSAP